MLVYTAIIVLHAVLVKLILQLIIRNLLSFVGKEAHMTEQMIVDAAKLFKKRVKDGLFDRDMTQRDLANAVGVTEAVLSLAINTYAINKQSREVRAKVRKLLDIQDI